MSSRSPLPQRSLVLLVIMRSGVNDLCAVTQPQLAHTPSTISMRVGITAPNEQKVPVQQHTGSGMTNLHTQASDQAP